MHQIEAEFVRDFDGLYYVNLYIDGVSDVTLPELVTYPELKRAVRQQYGFSLPLLKDLTFRRCGRKAFAVKQWETEIPERKGV